MLTPSKPVILVAAVADNSVIGSNGTIPWRLSADMRHFKAATLGRPVVMGRKTFESLPKPLPERANIVISSQPGYSAHVARNLAPLGSTVVVVDGVEAAILLADQCPFAACRRNDAIIVAGGSEIYRAAMPLASQLVLTHVHLSPQGDALFPHVADEDWAIESSSDHGAVGDQPSYSITTYVRRSTL